ncbi:hypothetical protein C8R46DRAFT_1206873 [Mycena filopes]|nr:hypothetical protein C8R46DRAFT_1206873 [Mycena filopes]
MHIPTLVASQAPQARDVLVANIAAIVGPMFIGNILNWMLFGTLIMQLWTYYHNFPHDSRPLRGLVYLVFFMDAVQTVLLTHHGWWFTITIWGVPDKFEELVWSAPTIPFMAGLISGSVQCFYAWRIWVLTNNKWMHGVSVLIVLVALTQALNAMVAALITWLAGSLANDVVITTCMLWILTRAKNQSAWGPTESLLTKLIHRVIQSGETVHLTLVAYILGKVYSNSFFLTLNLRRPQTGAYSDHVINTQDSIQLRGAIGQDSTLRANGSSDELKFASRDQQTTLGGTEHTVSIHKIGATKVF